MQDTHKAGPQLPDWHEVSVTFEEGIAWVTMNRPAKRNAMSPALNREMLDVLDRLETDPRCKVLILSGAGEAFSAGMDLKAYFRETDGLAPTARTRVYREAGDWQWRRLRFYPKATIAMVNGWCLGGAFTPMIACDLAVAAEEARFGLSEINWGIIPAGNVSKAVSEVLGSRAALYYIMTGETFDGRKAASLGLVNEAVPAADLRSRTAALAGTLMAKNPFVLRQAKVSFRHVQELDWEAADDYLRAKQEEGRALDPEHGREQGMRQFLDERSFRPATETYRR